MPAAIRRDRPVVQPSAEEWGARQPAAPARPVEESRVSRFFRAWWQVAKAQALDAPGISLNDFKGNAGRRVFDQLATRRNVPGQVGYQAPDRIDVFLPLFFGKDGAYLLFEILHRSAGIGDKRAIGAPGHVWPLDDVMLVLDLADDLFDQILHGDKPVHAAEFIDNQSKMTALQAHLQKEVKDSHRRRDELGRSKNAGKAEVAPAASSQHVLDVYHTGNVVEGAAIDRHTAMAAFRDGFQYPVEISIQGEGDDVGARHHHVIGRQMAQLQDIAEQRPLVATDGHRFLIVGILDLADDLFQGIAQLLLFAIAPPQACRDPVGCTL